VIFDPRSARSCGRTWHRPCSTACARLSDAAALDDEFPLVKFSDRRRWPSDRGVEIRRGGSTPTKLGLALARVAGVADRVFDETRGWL